MIYYSLNTAQMNRFGLISQLKSRRQLPRAKNRNIYFNLKRQHCSMLGDVQDCTHNFQGSPVSPTTFFTSTENQGLKVFIVLALLFILKKQVSVFSSFSKKLLLKSLKLLLYKQKLSGSSCYVLCLHSENTGNEAFTSQT